MDIVFGRDLFPRPVELIVRISFRRNYLCNSPVENKNDLELDLKFFSLLILFVQTLYLMNQTDATLASLSVLKY